MATVTGFTADRMLEIEGSTVVGGSVVNGRLILTTHSGLLIDAGSVVGPPGTTTWAGLSGKPTTFAPSAHKHPASDINSGIFDVARIPNVLTPTGSASLWLKDGLGAELGIGPHLIVNIPNGRVDVTTRDPFTIYGVLRLPNTADASLTSTDHAFQIGQTSGINLIIDNNELIARNNGASSTFFFGDGTNLQVDGTIKTVQNLEGSGKLILTKVEPGYDCTFIQSPERVVFSLPGSTARQRIDTGAIVTGGNIQSSSTYDNTYTSSANMYVTSYGTFGRATSTVENKLVVEPVGDELDDKILGLELVTWFDRHDSEVYNDYLTAVENGDPLVNENGEDLFQMEEIRRIPGMLAEKVEEAGLKEFVRYDDDNAVTGIMDDRLGLALIPVVSRLRDRVVELETEKEQMKTDIETLKSQMAQLLSSSS